jgi:hypothetical protein
MEMTYKRTSYKQWKAIIDRYIAKLKSDANWLENCPDYAWEQKFKAGMVPSEGIADEIGWADEEKPVWVWLLDRM